MAKSEDQKSAAPQAAEPQAAAPETSAADELRKAIVKPAPVESRARHAPPKINPALAGTYLVKHGTVHFGQGVFAEPGAEIRLDAHDAHHMLAVGAIEPID